MIVLHTEKFSKMCYIFLIQDNCCSLQISFSLSFASFKSFTLRGDHRSPASAQKSFSRSTVPTPTKRRSSVLWSEMLDISMKESLTTREIKRQEVCRHSVLRPYLLSYAKKEKKSLNTGLARRNRN